MPFCWFCRVAAQMLSSTYIHMQSGHKSIATKTTTIWGKNLNAHVNPKSRLFDGLICQNAIFIMKFLIYGIIQRQRLINYTYDYFISL